SPRIIQCTIKHADGSLLRSPPLLSVLANWHLLEGGHSSTNAILKSIDRTGCSALIWAITSLLLASHPNTSLRTTDYLLPQRSRYNMLPARNPCICSGVEVLRECSNLRLCSRVIN